MKPWTDIGSSFCFPEIVQVYSNSTLITQSSINPQYTKNQPPLALTINKYSTRIKLRHPR